MFVLCLNLFLLNNAKQFVILMRNAKQLVPGKQVLPGIVWEGQHVWVFPILAFNGELHLVSGGSLLAASTYDWCCHLHLGTPAHVKASQQCDDCNTALK